MYRPSIDNFSDSYFIFSDARVVEHNRDYTIIANDTYDYLSRVSSEPLLKVGTEHVWPRGENAVPPDVVAVPRRASRSSDHVLVAKPETRDELVDSGAVGFPNGDW